MRIASFETMAVRIPREPGPSAPREEADYVTLRCARTTASRASPTRGSRRRW